MQSPSNDRTTYTDRYEKLGSARLDALARMQSPDDYDKLWPEPSAAATPRWGDCWKACVEYAVPNLQAEIGFYIEVLNFSVNAYWDNRVMLISPDGAVSFTLFDAPDVDVSKVLNMQFMVANILEVESAMRHADIPFVQDLAFPWGKEAQMQTFIVQTPCGISLTVWGMTET